MPKKAEYLTTLFRNVKESCMFTAPFRSADESLTVYQYSEMPKKVEHFTSYSEISMELNIDHPIQKCERKLNIL